MTRSPLRLMRPRLTWSGLTLLIATPCVALAATKAPSNAEASHLETAGSSYEKLPTPKKGGTEILRILSNPKVINPLLSTDTVSQDLEPYLFARLLRVDSDNLKFIPYLASSVDVSADRKTYRFVLNKDAVWQDGTPVTTADVKFTYDTLMSPKTESAQLRSFWDGTRLTIIDTRTFEFVVDAPRFFTLSTLADFAPIQKKQFESEPDFNKAKGVLEPVGSGPYTFKSFSRDQQLVFTRNKSWWGSKLPPFKGLFNADEIVFRITGDVGLAYERFIKGDIDVLEFNAEQYATKVKGVDKDRFGDAPTSGKPIWSKVIDNKASRQYTYVGWNLRNPLFKDVRVRRALAQIIDARQIIDKVYFGLWEQTTSPWGSFSENSDPELRKPGHMLTFDRKKAIALLREAGWKDSDGDNVLDRMENGKKVDFHFTLKFNSNNPLRGKVAQVVKENMKAAGIIVDVRSVEWNSYLDEIDKRDFDAIVMGWAGTNFPDPRQIWHSKSEANAGSNFGNYVNPKADELIDKANAEFDPAKRAAVMRELNRVIYEDQPYAFLAEPKAILGGFTSKVKAPVWAMAYDRELPDELYSYAP